MNWRGDDRAQSVQIGAILLFATLVIALSMYQATIVPSQNADIEYKHSQTVQNQMTDVRNGILRSAATGNAQPVSVTLGTQYPSRVFLMNPPPATGTLRTGSYENNTIRVSNINATNDETRDFLNGNWTASTKYLEYEPNYHEYDNAPNLLYETSILSNFYPNTNNGTAIPLTEQLLVDNETRTITLVTLNGSLSTSRASSVTVSPETLSAPYQRVQVQPNQTGEPVNVSVPTLMAPDRLAERTDLGQNPGVIAVQNDTRRANAVNVTVEWDGEFTLQTARVGVGSGTENPPAHYLTLVENRGDRVTVEVRDQFNNAESGVDVAVNTSTPSNLFENERHVTNENGQAAFEVVDNESGSATLSILDNDEVYERVTVNVSGAGLLPDDEQDTGPSADLAITMIDDGPGRSDDTYELDASESTGDITEYEWDFNNDGEIDETTNSPLTTTEYKPNNVPAEARVIVSGPNGQDQAVAPYSGDASPEGASYPDVYNDYDGSTGTNEDNSIPPGSAARGFVANFERVQSDQRNDQYEGFARLETNYPNSASSHRMDIGMATEGVSTSGSSYEVEVEYRFYNSGDANPGDYRIQVVTGSGNVLQTETIDEIGTYPTEKQFSLNSAATNFVQNNGEVYTRYRYDGGEYSQILVYYQKVLVS